MKKGFHINEQILPGRAHDPIFSSDSDTANHSGILTCGEEQKDRAGFSFHPKICPTQDLIAFAKMHIFRQRLKVFS